MLELKAQSRKLTGKKVKQLRKQDLVPASINFAHEDTINITITHSDAQRLANLTDLEVISLDVDGKTYTTVVQAIHTNPLTNKILTIDFNEITKDRTVKVQIPVHTTGISPAVKNNIGVLISVIKTLDIRTTLDKVKPYLEVDISDLEKVGDTVFIKDIKLPEGIVLNDEKSAENAAFTIRPMQKMIEEEEAEKAEAEAEAAEGEGEEGEGEEGAEGEETAKGEGEDEAKEGEAKEADNKASDDQNKPEDKNK